jgi:hypothetical protein
MLLTYIPTAVLPSAYHFFSMNKIKAVLCLGVSGICLFGFAGLIIRRCYVLSLSVFLQVVMVVVSSNGPAGYRYHLPLNSIYLFLFFLGARDLFTDRMQRFRQFRTILAAVIATAVIVDHVSFNLVRNVQWPRDKIVQESGDFRRMCSCAGALLPDSTVLYSMSPCFTYLYSGRTTLDLATILNNKAELNRIGTDSGNTAVVIPAYTADQTAILNQLTPYNLSVLSQIRDSCR